MQHRRTAPLGIVGGRAHEGEQLPARTNRRLGRRSRIARCKIDPDSLERPAIAAQPHHVAIAQAGKRAAAERFGAGVHALAVGRTTELSRALLKHAAAGRVSGEFAAVVRALIGQGDLDTAVATLLTTGSTSGRAMALGLCTAIDLAERTTRPR